MTRGEHMKEFGESPGRKQHDFPPQGTNHMREAPGTALEKRRVDDLILLSREATKEITKTRKTEPTLEEMTRDAPHKDIVGGDSESVAATIAALSLPDLQTNPATSVVVVDLEGKRADILTKAAADSNIPVARWSGSPKDWIDNCNLPADKLATIIAGSIPTGGYDHADRSVEKRALKNVITALERMDPENPKRPSLDTIQGALEYLAEGRDNEGVLDEEQIDALHDALTDDYIQSTKSALIALSAHVDSLKEGVRDDITYSHDPRQGKPRVLEVAIAKGGGDPQRKADLVMQGVAQQLINSPSKIESEAENDFMGPQINSPEVTQIAVLGAEHMSNATREQLLKACEQNDISTIFSYKTVDDAIAERLGINDAAVVVLRLQNGRVADRVAGVIGRHKVKQLTHSSNTGGSRGNGGVETSETTTTNTNTDKGPDGKKTKHTSISTQITTSKRPVDKGNYGHSISENIIDDAKVSSDTLQSLDDGTCFVLVEKGKPKFVQFKKDSTVASPLPLEWQLAPLIEDATRAEEKFNKTLNPIRTVYEDKDRKILPKVTVYENDHARKGKTLWGRQAREFLDEQSSRIRDHSQQEGHLLRDMIAVSLRAKDFVRGFDLTSPDFGSLSEVQEEVMKSFAHAPKDVQYNVLRNLAAREGMDRATITELIDRDRERSDRHSRAANRQQQRRGSSYE